MKSIPQWVLVMGVLVLGTLALFFVQKPHSVCENQYEVLKTSFVGELFPQQVNKTRKPAQFAKWIESCRLGNSSGACFELISFYKRFLRKTQVLNEACLAELPKQETPYSKMVRDGLQLMALLAWGDSPPPEGTSRFGWFEAPDLQTFCGLKSILLRTEGEEVYRGLLEELSGRLPYEKPNVVDGKCLNCTQLKMASDEMSFEEIWVRSLFSVRCDAF